MIADTVSSGDVADDVDLVHGDLPVSLFLGEAHRSGLVPLRRITLNTQKHRALRTTYIKLV